jgi:peptidoglycan hydrolase-like protein with peptidoglycan-binding domain
MNGRFVVALAVGLIAAGGPLSAQGTGPQDPTKMPKDQIANVQQALQLQGYNPGAVDGTWGPTSEEALKEFQANRSIPTSHGQIDSMTLHALHVAAH